MASRIYLHVGTMKSATTYLQTVCNENAAALDRAGLLWLGSAANYGAVAAFYTGLAGRTASEYSNADPGSDWSTFAARLRDHEGIALVSNEMLYMRERDKIHAIVDRLSADSLAEIEVVVTARDLARVIPSQWQERSRNNPGDSWSEFVARLMAKGSDDDPALRWFWRRQDLGTIVTKFASVVGIDHVTVVTVPPPGSPSRLVAERFFEAIGISPPLSMPDAASINPALGAHSAEFLRRLRDRLTDDQSKRLRIALKYVLARRVLTPRHEVEPGVGLSSDALAWARDRAKREIAILETTGVRVVGSLDDLMPGVGKPRVLEDPAAASDADLRDVGLDAVIGLLEALDVLARSRQEGRRSEVLRRLARRDRASR